MLFYQNYLRPKCCCTPAIPGYVAKPGKMQDYNS